MTKYITYLSKAEVVLEIKLLNTRSLHICSGAKRQCVTHFYLWGLGGGMSAASVWLSQICDAQCTKRSLKLNNDQSENYTSGG